MSEQSPGTRLKTIAHLKQVIKNLQAELDAEIAEMQADIELGLLDDYEVDGGYVFDNVRCTPVQTTRWEYSEEFKDYVKQIQARAQYSGEATPKTSIALRFKW